MYYYDVICEKCGKKMKKVISRDIKKSCNNKCKCNYCYYRNYCAACRNYCAACRKYCTDQRNMVRERTERCPIRQCGERGPMGPRGERGPMGPRGERGSMGPRGERGPIGKNGVTGSTGSIGVTGATGSIGITGVTGLIGVTGVTGATGAKGDNGFGSISTILKGSILSGGISDSSNIAYTNNFTSGTDIKQVSDILFTLAANHVYLIAQNTKGSISIPGYIMVTPEINGVQQINESAKSANNESTPSVSVTSTFILKTTTESVYLDFLLRASSNVSNLTGSISIIEIM